MRLLPAALVALLVSWQASAEPLNYSIYKLQGSKSNLLAEDRLDYTAGDIDVQKWRDHEGRPAWKKSLKLKEGFRIGAMVGRLDRPRGFGLWIAQDDSPAGFSWEWFVPDDGNVYKKLQGEGYLRAQFAKSEDGVVLQSVEFLTDVRLRFLEDVMLAPAKKKTHEVVVTQGSILRFADGT